MKTAITSLVRSLDEVSKETALSIIELCIEAGVHFTYQPDKGLLKVAAIAAWLGLDSPNHMCAVVKVKGGEV